MTWVIVAGYTPRTATCSVFNQLSSKMISRYDHIVRGGRAIGQLILSSFLDRYSHDDDRQ